MRNGRNWERYARKPTKREENGLAFARFVVIGNIIKHKNLHYVKERFNHFSSKNIKNPH